MLKKKKDFTATTELLLDRTTSLAKLTDKINHCKWDNTCWAQLYIVALNKRKIPRIMSGT